MTFRSCLQIGVTSIVLSFALLAQQRTGTHKVRRIPASSDEGKRLRSEARLRRIASPVLNPRSNDGVPPGMKVTVVRPGDSFVNGSPITTIFHKGVRRPSATIKADTFNVPAGTMLRFDGFRSVSVVARKTVTIAGTVSAVGGNGTDGDYGVADWDFIPATPGSGGSGGSWSTSPQGGGGAGGDGDTSYDGTGPESPGRPSMCVSDESWLGAGGSGGGNGTLGAKAEGAGIYLCPNGAKLGVGAFDESVAPAGGGGPNGTPDSLNCGTSSWNRNLTAGGGGGGGGAGGFVSFTSETEDIVVSGTINVSGGNGGNGGDGATFNFPSGTCEMTLLGSAGGGGGGGGAGGHILLSALGNVSVTGTLLANGGNGA